MTNFIFKSSTTLKKLANTLEVILNEQRHQRNDLASLIRSMRLVTNQFNLENTVKGYYSDQDKLDPVEPEDNASP